MRLWPLTPAYLRMVGYLAPLLLGLMLSVQLAAAASGVRVESPWARASLGGVKNAIVYGAIVNDGPSAVRVIGGSTPVAGRVEFHIHAMDGSVMTMRQLDSIDLLQLGPRLQGRLGAGRGFAVPRAHFLADVAAE